MVEAPRVRVGTAGWSVVSDLADQFPPSGSHLERYARRMVCTEINSSFYKPHRRSTYDRWASSTPGDFLFSVKLPKAISHDHALISCAEPLSRFFDAVVGLGEKLGVVLIQLPPKLAFDDSAFERFIDDFRECSDVAVALEPRHATWFSPDVEDKLKARRIARVAADPAKAPGAGVPGGWNGLVYYRWHGAPRVYYSSYDVTELKAVASDLQTYRKAARQSWFIFDNTASGAALGNALTLSSLLD
jgi:uncharacterized protein YecE (DUF72 family)